MADTTANSHANARVSMTRRLLVLLAFLICVNLLAGYAAITLGYPSLYNVKSSFSEYAVPLPFYWGFLHIPSMLVYGTGLVLLPGPGQKWTGYFRILCVLSFALLLMEWDRKIPFLLFPKVDALAALAFSLFIAPPNRRDNPVLTTTIKLSLALGTILLGYLGYSLWSHRAPEISNTRYASGTFELKSISVRNDFKKSMVFDVDLKSELPEDQLCVLAQSLAAELLTDYPFDETYTKEVAVTFKPLSLSSGSEAYELGVITLSDRYRENDGSFPCYLKYRTRPPA
ncbi:hypothetical protein [Dokdonella sp.]|uniref:hypothetical protein n=1 Tax=Dokdonella sp. TaxID=2291710 RepID=UPI003529044E